MKASGLYAIALSLSMVAVAAAGTFTVDITRTDGSDIVEPGETVEFQILGDLTTEDGNLGLAFFAFDLELIVPGDADPINLGTALMMFEGIEMGNFSAPQGYSIDFTGTPIGDDLIQAGGGQNTINNPGPPDFPDFPTGDVDLNVGHGGVVLFEGGPSGLGFGLTVPAEAGFGEYTLQIIPNSLYANEIVSEDAGEYEVDPVDAVSIGDSMTFEVDESCLSDPAVLTHALGAGETFPCSGYINPLAEGDVDTGGCAGGETFGIDTVQMKFNVEVYGAPDGATPVSAGNFSVTETGGGSAPGIVSATPVGDNSLIEIQLDRFITLGEWTTIIASDVYNPCGVQLDTSGGNQGPGVNEPDRLDVAAYPGDINQDGDLSPFDVLDYRLFVQNGTIPANSCTDDPLLLFDMDHSGSIAPFDLLELRLLVNEGCTQDWNAAAPLGPRP